MINLINSIVPVISLLAGIFLGYSLGKKHELPELKTPGEIVKEKKEEIKISKQNDTNQAYMENIENYPYNQKDIVER